MRRSTGRAYYDRKIAEGKTHNEAMRCLKRRLADHVWRIMLADERRTTPGGCKARFSCRSPPRGNRCRARSALATSTGATPA
jgi:hypothetical protein